MESWEKLFKLTKVDVKPGEVHYGYTVANEDSDVYLGLGWDDDSHLYQSGTCKNVHCKTEDLVSWAKNVICPTCQNPAYLT